MAQPKVTGLKWRTLYSLMLFPETTKRIGKILLRIFQDELMFSVFTDGKKF